MVVAVFKRRNECVLFFAKMRKVEMEIGDGRNESLAWQSKTSSLKAEAEN